MTIRVGIGDSVCDRYTGSCGRIIDIINDEVMLEPTLVKKGGLEVTEPPIRAKIANLELNHIRRGRFDPLEPLRKDLQRIRKAFYRWVEEA